MQDYQDYIDRVNKDFLKKGFKEIRTFNFDKPPAWTLGLPLDKLSIYEDADGQQCDYFFIKDQSLMTDETISINVLESIEKSLSKEDMDGVLKSNNLI